MVSPQPGKHVPELDPPVLTVVGERVALGPLRRDLLPAYGILKLTELAFSGVQHRAADTDRSCPADSSGTP
jgi:hypothetical protein